MDLSTLLQKRVVFVSGKGGTGKTTVSVLLGLLAAKQKKKTLLVEMNSYGNVSPIFQSKNDSVDEIPLAPYISGINISPKRCLEEYIIKHVKFKSIYKTFFNNKYVSNFLDATPGLSEILMLGKICELEQQIKNKVFSERQYDFIVVDLPATGHGISSLELPHVIISAIKIGPLAKQAKMIIELMSNEALTTFCLVTLAEEMSVTESEEYLKALSTKTDLNFGPIFINSVFPECPKIKKPKVIPDHLEKYWKYHELSLKRYQLNQHHIHQIEEKFPDLSRIILPYQFHPLNEVQDFMPLIQSCEEAMN